MFALLARASASRSACLMVSMRSLEPLSSGRPLASVGFLPCVAWASPLPFSPPSRLHLVSQLCSLHSSRGSQVRSQQFPMHGDVRRESDARPIFFFASSTAVFACSISNVASFHSQLLQREHLVCCFQCFHCPCLSRQGGVESWSHRSCFRHWHCGSFSLSRPLRQPRFADLYRRVLHLRLSSRRQILRSFLSLASSLPLPATRCACPAWPVSSAAWRALPSPVFSFVSPSFARVRPPRSSLEVLRPRVLLVQDSIAILPALSLSLSHSHSHSLSLSHSLNCDTRAVHSTSTCVT